jgi:hypothetical protein
MSTDQDAVVTEAVAVFDEVSELDATVEDLEGGRSYMVDQCKF